MPSNKISVTEIKEEEEEEEEAEPEKMGTGEWRENGHKRRF